MTRRFKSVVYDNRQQDAFIVTRDDNTTFTFVPLKEGLYFYDFQNSINREAIKKGAGRTEHNGYQHSGGTSTKLHDQRIEASRSSKEIVEET
jgi:hypothetical protein